MSDDGLMMVDSEQLASAAKRLRESVGTEPAVLRNSVKANAPQLEAAAQILREAEPSVITSPPHLASTTERPGFIDRDQQESDDVLVFTMGILPSTTYRIGRDGRSPDA